MPALEPVPLTPLRDDPGQDAIWKRWLQRFQIGSNDIAGDVSTLNSQVSVVAAGLSNEVSVRNALSATVSVNAAQVSALSVAVSVVRANLSVLSVQVSALDARESALSVLHSALSVRVAGILSAPVSLFASTSAAPSLRIPPGVAPAAPGNGDIWMTSAGLFYRISGVTTGPLT